MPPVPFAPQYCPLCAGRSLAWSTPWSRSLARSSRTTTARSSHRGGADRECRDPFDSLWTRKSKAGQESKIGVLSVGSASYNRTGMILTRKLCLFEEQIQGAKQGLNKGHAAFGLATTYNLQMTKQGRALICCLFRHRPCFIFQTLYCLCVCPSSLVLSCGLRVCRPATRSNRGCRVLSMGDVADWTARSAGPRLASASATRRGVPRESRARLMGGLQALSAVQSKAQRLPFDLVGIRRYCESSISENEANKAEVRSREGPWDRTSAP